MPSIVQASSVEIKGGTLLTFIGTPNKCAYWEVVGWNGASETVPVGTLVESITVNDGNGFSVNSYISSTSSLDAGKIERIKVTESA